MEVFTLDSTDDTPEILLDHVSGKFKFSGKSLPEDVKEFYKPVIDWLEEYSIQPQAQTEVEFRMDYFNSASSKQIMDILTLLEKINENGNSILIKWLFQEDDEDMQEAGESYAEIIDIPFEIISIE